MASLSAFTQFGGAFTGAMSTILPIVVVLIVVGVMLYLLFLKKLYNIEIEIFSPRADGYKILKDRGGFIKSKGITEFKLLKQKAIVPGITLEHVFSSGRKNYVKLLEIDKGELLPLNVVLDKENLKIHPEETDIKEYRNQRFIKNRMQWEKKSIFEKLVPVLTIAVPAVLVIVLMYMVLKDLGSISNTLAGATRALAAACGGG